MEKLNLSVFLIICVGSLSLALDDKKYCFQFTWVAPMYDNKPERYNCTLLEGSKVPCIEPLINTEKTLQIIQIPEELPNTHDLWENKTESMMCSLSSGNVCLRYTFMFNHNIVNTSLFCGKAIEDQVTPITSGCYEQNVDGYTIEVCACESRKGKEPCNSTMEIKYSIVLMISSLAFIITNSIYYQS